MLMLHATLALHLNRTRTVHKYADRLHGARPQRAQPNSVLVLWFASSPHHLSPYLWLEQQRQCAMTCAISRLSPIP